MFCKYCGSELKEDADFCLSCGRRIKDEVKKDNSIDIKYIIVSRGKKKYYLVNIKY